MAARPVEIKRRGKTGKTLIKIEPLGGVFCNIEGQRTLRPAYSIGPEQQRMREVMFQCPVSAIPDEVWQLVALWNRCRMTGTLPVAGGFLDQPMAVQRAFPVLEAEWRKAEALNGGKDGAAIMALAAVMGAGGGGKGKG